MGLVDSWLEGIGLGYAVPIFAGQGISSPDALSELDVVDFPELGISNHNDRKKLFYLIQRVRLAIDRNRPSDDEDTGAAPPPPPPPRPSSDREPANAPASSAIRPAAEADGRPPSGAESSDHHNGGQASSNAPPVVRLRRELEIPEAVRESPGTTGGRSAAPAGSDTPEQGTQAPIKMQRRLPPSHRRPKTPHVDGSTSRAAPPRTGNVAGGGDDNPKAPPASNASFSSLGSEKKGTRAGARIATPERARHPRAAAAAGNDIAGTEARPRATLRARADRSPATAPSPRRKSNRDKHSVRRSVLEPVQLDETGVRTAAPAVPRPASSRAPAGGGWGSCGLGRTADARSKDGRGRGSPFPLRRRHSSRGLGLDGSSPDAISVSTDGLPVFEEALTDGYRAVDSARAVGSRRSTVAERARDPVASNDRGLRSGRIREMARLRSGKATRNGDGSEGDDSGFARELASRRGDARYSTGVSRTGATATPRSGDEGGGGQQREKGFDGEAASPFREEARNTLATDLIAAHREDVRSALAAARRDMDLVSKADQDRHPAALLEYAREVEDVLGERIAAGAKLRAALDSYVALRKAETGHGDRGRGSFEEGGVRAGRAF